MAIKHRTKEQKKAAAQRRLTYSLPSTIKSSTISSNEGVSIKSVKTTTSADIFDYPPELIKRDMLSTVIISLIVLAVELGLYFYL